MAPKRNILNVIPTWNLKSNLGEIFTLAFRFTFQTSKVIKTDKSVI